MRRHSQAARQGTRLGLVMLPLCCLAAAPVGVSAASPAPAFLAQWQRVDRLVAQSDLLGAEQAITPLLATAATLDQGAERFWFAVSAERILGAVGRSDEATAAHDEILAAGNSIGEPPSSFGPPATSSEAIRCQAGWQLVPGRGGSWRVGGLVAPPVERNGEFMGTPRPGGYLSVRGSGMPGDVFGGSANDGDALLIPSYFGGVRRYRAPLRGGRPQQACNGLPVKGNGAPWTFMTASYRRRVPIAIPATTPAVATRRLAPRGRFEAQVLAPDGTTVTAWWTYPIRSNRFVEGARRLRTTGVVKDRRVRLQAPARKGQYVLKLTAGPTTKASTTINGIGIGMKPYRYKETWRQVCTDESCSPPRGRG